MQHLKIIRLLKALKPEEISECRKYIISRVKSSGSVPVKLFDLLRKYHPDFDNRGLQREKIFVRLFPGERFGEKKFFQTVSKLSLILEEYFAVVEVRTNDFLKQKMLANAYGKRNLHQFFERTSETLISKLDNTSVQTPKDFLELFQLNIDLFFHPNTPRHRRNITTIKAVMTNLDLFYVTAKVKYACELMNRKQILGEEYEIPLLEAVEKFFDKMPDNKPFLYDTYLKIIELQNNKGTGNLFEEIKTIFIKNEEVIPKEEQHFIFGYLLNYAGKRVNLGHFAFNYDIFELYKFGLKNGLVVQQDKLADTTFVNIAVVGSVTKNFEWTERFIEENAKYVTEHRREDAKNLSLGYYHYYKGFWENDESAFDKVINDLKYLEFKFQPYALRAKSLLLRTYYDYFLNKPKNYDFVLKFIEAFTRFISNLKFLDDKRKQAYRNYIRFTKKLSDYKTQNTGTRTDLENLKNDINETNYLTARFWLLEKVEELLKSPNFA